MDGCDAPHFHCVGNHELYNFSPSELVEGPLNRGRHAVAKDGSLYFSFERDGWTFVVLNPYPRGRAENACAHSRGRRPTPQE